MDTYLKSIGIAIVGILLCLILSKNAKDYAVLIGILLCCALLTATIGFLKPVIELLKELTATLSNGQKWLNILLKAVGLSLIGETATSICSDAGQVSVGKAIQLLTGIVILWVALPLVQSLLELIRTILEML